MSKTQKSGTEKEEKAADEMAGGRATSIDSEKHTDRDKQTNKQMKRATVRPRVLLFKRLIGEAAVSKGTRILGQTEAAAGVHTSPIPLSPTY